MATTQQAPANQDASKEVPASTPKKQAPKRPHTRRRKYHQHSHAHSHAGGFAAPMYPTHPQAQMLMPQMVLPAVPMANLIPSQYPAQYALYPDMKVYPTIPTIALPVPTYPTSATSEEEAAKAQKKQETATANALATVTVNPIIPIKDLPEAEMEDELELDEPLTFGDELGDDMYDIDDDLTGLTGTQTEDDPQDILGEEDPFTSDVDNSPSRQDSGVLSPLSRGARPLPSILKRSPNSTKMAEDGEEETKEASTRTKRTVTFASDTEFIERTLQFEIEKANPSFRRQRKPRSGGSFSAPRTSDDSNTSEEGGADGSPHRPRAPPLPTSTALSPPPSASDNSGSENSGSDYPKDLQRALGLQTRKISDEAKEEARKAAANRRRTRGTFKVV